jgi:hypothetical protein
VGVLFGLAFAAACAFIFLLIRFDVSPKNFLYRVTKRFMEPPEGLRPVVRNAPYRRTNDSKGLHRPILLNLETSDGSGQACHPDVVHIPEGFGSGKWPYWMVCTPYPYQDGYFENPEIFVSCDGVGWTVPRGLRNPVVPFPKHPGDHNSDPDLIFLRDEFWLFYRMTIRSKKPREIPDENKILVMKSVDGIRWSEPTEILSERQRAELVSPAVIHDGTHFVMWTVEIDGQSHYLKRRTSLDGLIWSLPATTKMAGLPDGRQPWHIDVIREEDRLSAILVSCVGPGGVHSRIHYAYSLDHGLNWSVSDFLFEQSYEFESKHQYRATFRRAKDAPAVYELWYSACSLADVFSVAYMKLVRAGSALVPYES